MNQCEGIYEKVQTFLLIALTVSAGCSPKPSRLLMQKIRVAQHFVAQNRVAQHRVAQHRVAQHFVTKTSQRHRIN